MSLYWDVLQDDFLAELLTESPKSPKLLTELLTEFLIKLLTEFIVELKCTLISNLAILSESMTVLIIKL